jgi:PKD repeat protein
MNKLTILSLSTICFLLFSMCKDLDKPEPVLTKNDTVANFSFTSTNSFNTPSTVAFSNASTGTGTLTYLWNFADPTSGNANTSTLKDPSHEFKTAGLYDVTLTVTGINGSKEINKLITITAPIPSFKKIIIGSTNESLSDVVETSNGGFIAVGSAYNSKDSKGRALVLKFDAKGEVIANYQIGELTKSTDAVGVALNSDGSFFMGATVYNPTTSKFEAQIFKISSNDIVQTALTKVFTADYIEMRRFHKTNDGGCIFTGVKRKTGLDKNKIWVAKLDANFNTVFDVTFDGWTGTDVVQITDQNYIVVGEGEISTYKAIKIDNLGAEIKKEGPYNHAEVVIPYGVSIAKDGTPIITGDAQNSTGGNSYYAYLLNISTDISYKWHKAFGGADFSFGRSIAVFNNGDIVIVGNAGSDTNSDALFIKTDAQGNNPQRKQFGEPQNNEGLNKIITTKDGGLLMVGYSNDPKGTSDAYIIKTDKNGNIQ